MSTLSKAQQSIASGLFQTVTRLCVTVGMGVSTAIFSSAQKTNIDAPGFHTGDPIRPYAATFWFCTAAAGASLFLVPWVTIGTQGHRVSIDDVEVEEVGTGQLSSATGSGSREDEKGGVHI
jgi:hypothetical protein